MSACTNGWTFPFLACAVGSIPFSASPSAARSAASRADAADLAALGEALKGMEPTAHARNGNVQPFVQADMRFHLAILHACRNELLEQMSRVVYSALLVS